MKHILNRLPRLVAFAVLLLCSLQGMAQTMSDDQVYDMIEKEYKNGTSKSQIVTKLMQRGVSMDQIRRVRAKFQKQKDGELMGGKSVIGTSNRTRKNNGDQRNDNRREPIFSNKTSDEALDYRDRQMEMYSQELDFIFPDSMALYLEEYINRSKKVIFGHDIFNNNNVTFESSMNLATPANYILGPGDEVFVDVYGASQKNFNVTVSPEGTLDLEGFGPVAVSGLTVAQAQSRVRGSLGQRYSGSNIRLTVGQTKTISVQVMGAVNTPGTYTLSAFSSVFHALYMAGGVTDVGTLREIKVIRNNHIVATVDVYDYILNGKLSGNCRLQDNDVVIVGTYNCLVNVAGKVKRPMYYEMKPNESVETLLAYAGGFTGDAYQKTVRLVRKNGERYSMFTIDEFERGTFNVADGDSVNVDSTLQRFDNMVMLKGGVHRPGMYQIGGNITTVRELVEKADGLTPEAYATLAVLHRKKKDRSLRTISLDLKGIMDGTSPDVALENEDVIYIMDQNQQREELTMTIFGEVMYPGIYDYSENTTLSDLIVQAGGFKDGASTVKIDVARRLRDTKAKTSGSETAKTYSFSLENGLIVEGDTAFRLEPFDEIYVRSSPGYTQQQHVTIFGEIAFAGTYAINFKGMRLTDLIKMSGGLTDDAYAAGARLERLMSPDEKERQKVLLRMAAGSDSIALSKVEFGDTRPVGINLAMALKNPGNDEWDIVLEEGDKITIPQYRNTVSMLGEVMSPTTVSYKKGASLKHYLKNAGGLTSEAKSSRIFAVNMNGTVTKVSSGKDIQPGSEIVVPSKKKRTRMSIGEIMSLGTMSASLASLISVLL